MDSKRLESKNLRIIKTWYDRLGIVIQQYNIRLKNIYNLDETDFQLGEGKTQNIITANLYTAVCIPTGGLNKSLTSSELNISR
jgi:hypothetical protein